MELTWNLLKQVIINLRSDPNKSNYTIQYVSKYYRFSRYLVVFDPKKAPQRDSKKWCLQDQLKVSAGQPRLVVVCLADHVSAGGLANATFKMFRLSGSTSLNGTSFNVVTQRSLNSSNPIKKISVLNISWWHQLPSTLSEIHMVSWVQSHRLAYGTEKVPRKFASASRKKSLRWSRGTVECLAICLVSLADFGKIYGNTMK